MALNESFNKADSTTLGPDQTWTEQLGDLQVVSNACRAVSTGGASRAEMGGTAITLTRWKLTVKTFNTPSSGTNVVMPCCYFSGGTAYGARLMVDSTGTCTVDFINYFSSGTTPANTYAGPFTVTKPTAPFDLTLVVNDAGNFLQVNGVTIATGSGMLLQGNGGLCIIASANVADVEVDSVSFYHGDLPTPLTSSSTPATDGVGWVGPFIDSLGNVWVLTTGASTIPTPYKATDPVDSFTAMTQWSGGPNASLQVDQAGDTLHVVGGSSTAVIYRTYNMATDTWGTALTVTVSPMNSAVGCAKRSTGGDVIM